MKRPLTVRRWFRALLVVVVLVGGYIAAYLTLREWTDNPLMVVSIEYPHGERMFAISEEGRSSVVLYATLYEELDGLNSSHGVSMDQSVLESAVDPNEPLSHLYYTGGDGDWRATACRVFYLAERIELWARGFTVVDGEFAVVGE